MSPIEIEGRKLEALTGIETQLRRIAEVNKINLWFLMETKATDRQKGIISEVLKKL